MAALILAGAGCATSRQQTTLRVLTFNIHHGEGTDGKVDLQRIARLIKDNKIDLVALQEVDQNAKRTGHRDFPKELAILTGMDPVFGKNLDLEGGGYGNAILSRYPITSATNLHFPKIVPGEQRGMLMTTIRAPQGRLTFVAVHLDHRRPEQDRLASVEMIHKTLQPIRNNIIVAGDFNATPKTETHRQMVKENFFRDAWLEVGQGNGFTIPSENPRSRIDYIFYRGLTPRSATVPTSNASDHLPLIAEFELTSKSRP